MKRNTSVNSMGRIVRQNSIGGLALDSNGRPPSVTRSISHGYDASGGGSASPMFDNISIASGGTGTVNTFGGASVCNYMGGVPKPSPLVMPTPMMARSNSVADYRHSYRGPGSPMSATFQSPSPPLAGYGLEPMAIEEPVRALLVQVCNEIIMRMY